MTDQQYQYGIGKIKRYAKNVNIDEYELLCVLCKAAEYREFFQWVNADYFIHERKHEIERGLHQPNVRSEPEPKQPKEKDER